MTSLKIGPHKEELLEREIQRSSSELEVGAEGNVMCLHGFCWILYNCQCCKYAIQGLEENFPPTVLVVKRSVYLIQHEETKYLSGNSKVIIISCYLNVALASWLLSSE